VLPSGGKVSNLRVYLTNTKGAGNITIDLVELQPTYQVNSKLKLAMDLVYAHAAGDITIKGSATSCEDKANLSTFAAGDAISVVETASNSPESGAMFFRLDYQP